MNGRIKELSYDKEKIDQDRDIFGNIVTRDFGISCQNCQHAKVLSANVQ